MRREPIGLFRWLAPVLVLALAAGSSVMAQPTLESIGGKLQLLEVDPVGQKTNLWCWAASTQMILDYLEKEAPEQCEQASLRKSARSDEKRECCQRNSVLKAFDQKFSDGDSGWMRNLLTIRDEECVHNSWPLKNVWTSYRTTKELCRWKYLERLTSGPQIGREESLALFRPRRRDIDSNWLERIENDFLDDLGITKRHRDRKWLEKRLHRQLADEEDCTLTWSALKGILDLRSPVAFSHRWGGSAGHMMVATGYLETGSAGASEQWVVVNDPWPPGSGDRYLMPYEYWKRGATGRHWRVYWDDVVGKDHEIGVDDLVTTDPYPLSGDQATHVDWPVEKVPAEAKARVAVETLNKIDESHFAELELASKGAAIESVSTRLVVGRGLPVLNIGLEELKIDGQTFVDELRSVGSTYVTGSGILEERPLDEALFLVYGGECLAGNWFYGVNCHFVSLIGVRRSGSDWEVTRIGGSNLVAALSDRLAEADKNAVTSAVISIPECYQFFVLSFSTDDQESSTEGGPEPSLIPIFSQPELGFEQGHPVSPEELLSAVLNENGACGSPLGGAED